MSCNDKSVNKYSLTTDGNKITITLIEKTEGGLVAGSEY